MVAERTSIFPCSRVFVNTGEAITEENLLEFRLLYQGELLPCENANKRVPEKHLIRRTLHPQLRRLWSTKKNLRQLAITKSLSTSVAPETTLEERFTLGLSAIGKQWSRATYNFVPLVTDEWTVRCSLDILLLRPEGDRFIFTQGDIDGQVKTLFDALSIPDNNQIVGAPNADEDPLFCLLSNDRLITEVRVKSEQLLLLPHETEIKANDSFVVIHVRINHVYAGGMDRWLD